MPLLDRTKESSGSIFDRVGSQEDLSLTDAAAFLFLDLVPPLFSDSTLDSFAAFCEAFAYETSKFSAIRGLLCVLRLSA